MYRSELEIAAIYAAHVPAVKQTGKEWRGPCPIHKGKGDNFAVDANTGNWYCHSQCQDGGSLDQLLRKLSGEPAVSTPKPQPGQAKRVTATYGYTDILGRILFECVRFEPKTFRYRRPGPGYDMYGQREWIWNLDGVEPVLYRWHRWKDENSVFIVEGEKDVHTLEDYAGVPATCNPMGAGKWRDPYSEMVRGMHVTIIPDNDVPGRRHAMQVIRSLWGKVPTIAVLEAPQGKDVSDWLPEEPDANAAFAALRKTRRPLRLQDVEALRQRWGLADEPMPSSNVQHPPPSMSRLFPPPPAIDMKKVEQEAVEATVRDALDGAYTLADTQAREYEPPRFQVEGLLPEGVTLLAGRPKVGKSWFAMQIALDAAGGKAVLGRFQPRHKLKVLYFALEDSERRVAKRLRDFCPQGGAGLANVTVVHKLDPLLAGGAVQINRAIERGGFDLVIIDTLMKLLQASAKRDLVRSEYAEIDILREIAEIHKAAILVVCHTRKAEASYSVDEVIGTTGVTAACDSVWRLKRRPEGGAQLEVVGREIENEVLDLRRDGVQWVAETEKELGDTRASILEIIQDHGPVGPGRLAADLDKKPSTIRVFLHRMVADGQVRRTPSGLFDLPVTGQGTLPLAA